MYVKAAILRYYIGNQDPYQNICQLKRVISKNANCLFLYAHCIFLYCELKKKFKTILLSNTVSESIYFGRNAIEE